MTHASVFSGIGGPEVAATMLGWDNLFHCEINPFGKRVLDYWYPNAKSYDDITTTDFSEWRGKVNVLTGGFPCQPFSYAGKRRGADDDRYLWPFMFKCIDQIQPDWVVAENVGGILTMVEQGEVIQLEDTPTFFDEDDTLHRYQYRGTFTLERICSDLETHGYDVQPILIPACAVGAPHKRDRVFIIGHRTATDSACRGISGCDDNSQQCDEGTIGQSLQNREPNSVRNQQGRKSDASDTRSLDVERPDDNGIYRKDGRIASDETTAFHSASYQRQFDVSTRWETFPSVSPISRGNDGLPFNVDDLSIPEGKWRTEALKAYGNAIVPQVMYEIFRAIEQVQQQTLF